ncbi:MAG: lamin tail domain-containing protein [Bacteroidetes bacterium]|nr:lamin tail domain-containing protein [Bacteroidota bacterium]
MFKTTLLKLSFFACLTFVFQLNSSVKAQSCNLFISEYLEGTSNNKAIELYNPTGATLDLTDYVVYRYNNGTTTANDSLVFTYQTLAAGDVYVAANPSADATILAVADTLHTITFFNGDDAIVLYQVSTGKIIDKIGYVGVDPGTNWTVGNGATSEYTLVRMSSVTHGDTDWTVVETQWDVYSQDDFGYIGSHTGSGCCTKSTSSISPVVCGSYKSPSGKYTWTSSNTYYDTLTNAGGCDSIITINLSINNKTTSSISSTTCGSYKSPSGKYTWTTSNTYIDTIKNANGCDSVITINLTISNKATSSISAKTCGSYTSPSGKYVWNTSNTYTDTLKSFKGCDSVITINLTVNSATASNISPSACNSYTSPSGKILSASKTYADTIMNANGCDSVITINLTINTIDTSVSRTGNTFSASQAGATYQWVNCGNNYAPIANETSKTFTPTSSINAEVIVTLNNCSDTSNCHSFALVGFNEINGLNSISLYPNPAQNNLQISTEQSIKNATVRIVSITGQTVLELKNISGNTFNLDLSNLSQGMYMIELNENGLTSRNKFLKQ